MAVQTSNSLFQVSSDKVTYSSGEKTKIYRLYMNGVLDHEERITARCTITAVFKVYVQRGLRSPVTPSIDGSFSAATGTVGGVTFRFPEAQGTVVTTRGHRVNDAGFWEAEIVEETRTASIAEAV